MEKRNMKPFLAILILLCAAPALALDKPSVNPEAECCGCTQCYCDRECLCPEYVEANGKRVILAPVNRHPVAAAAKWTAAAPFRFIFSPPQKVWVPVTGPTMVPADRVRRYRPLVVE
jgi:hypothetical protein